MTLAAALVEPSSMEADSRSSNLVGFYLCENFSDQGRRVLLLAESKWTSYLRMRAKIPDKPFYTRQRRETEPETHPNGHPWGWVYKPEDVLRDESRWLSQNDFGLLKESLSAALLQAPSQVKNDSET